MISFFGAQEVLDRNIEKGSERAASTSGIGYQSLDLLLKEHQVDGALHGCLVTLALDIDADLTALKKVARGQYAPDGLYHVCMIQRWNDDDKEKVAEYQDDTLYECNNRVWCVGDKGQVCGPEGKGVMCDLGRCTG